MTLTQQIITIAVMSVAIILTRFLPFLFFQGRKTPRYVQYLGTVLPAGVFGLLVVYCLKNVSLIDSPHGIPELIGIGVTTLLHIWKRQMLLSIAGGTITYMLLVQFVFTQ